jgi:hypothetical protein
MLAIVSHDAGGAEVLSSYVRREVPSCVYVLAGPAPSIFARKLGTVATVALDAALAEADSLLCGTSWQSDLELDAIKLARSMGKQSVAALDHWVNYRERFTRGGEVHLPDEMWTFDRDAEALATKLFPGVRIRRLENPYLADTQRELAAIPLRQRSSDDGLSVLYVAEPVREHALRAHGDERYWGYVEEDALRYFLSHVEAIGGRISRVVVRPHPSEPAGKYEPIIADFDIPVKPGVRTLVEEIAASDVVVGCNSMAMVVGLSAGKRVISCIPPGGQPCNLPQREIEWLQQLVLDQATASAR